MKIYSIILLNENNVSLTENFNGSNMNEEKKDDGMLATSSTAFSNIYDRLGFEPHVYEISALAYSGLTFNRKDQTILVSGESGAGKTETVKIVLRHLVSLENRSSEHGNKTESESHRIVQCILESSPLFEAFGNAKTARNNNSSRFGKLTKLQYSKDSNESCTLVACRHETYLLETNRVVSHVTGERNFHIFYQLLSAPTDIKAKILGEDWREEGIQDFRYLSEQGAFAVDGKDDAMLFLETMQALYYFGWTGAKVCELFNAICVVLLLGNITFNEDDNGSAFVESESALHRFADFVGVDVDEVRRCMTHREIISATETVEIALNANSAREACDALAKRIYEAIFAVLVEKANSHQSQLERNEMAACIGEISLLDIYGFESFEINRFDQLCINYVNEKLQQKYVNDNIRRCTVEYEEEGIELFDFKVMDNSDIVSLFEGKNGIIYTLNEECLVPKGSNEVRLSKRLKLMQLYVSLTEFSTQRLLYRNLKLATVVIAGY